jgi:lysophospholipase L1-like esterase
MIWRVLGGTDVPRGTAARLQHHFELRPYKQLYDSEDHRRMEITTRIISLLDDFIKKNGMKFLIVEGLYKPVLDKEKQREIITLYGDQFDFDKVSRLLSEHTRKTRIPFLSLPRRLKDQDIDVNSLMHPEDSMHLNRKGIQFFAQAVVAKLKSLQWVDSN